MSNIERYKLNNVRATIPHMDNAGHVHVMPVEIHGTVELVIDYGESREIPIPELGPGGGYYVVNDAATLRLETGPDARFVLRSPGA